MIRSIEVTGPVGHTIVLHCNPVHHQQRRPGWRIGDENGSPLRFNFHDSLHCFQSVRYHTTYRRCMTLWWLFSFRIVIHPRSSITTTARRLHSAILLIEYHILLAPAKTNEGCTPLFWTTGNGYKAERKSRALYACFEGMIWTVLTKRAPFSSNLQVLKLALLSKNMSS